MLAFRNDASAPAFCGLPLNVKQWKIVNGIERPHFIANKTSVGIPDMDDGRKLLRQIDVPGTASYRGISASDSAGKLSSHRNDEHHGG